MRVRFGKSGIKVSELCLGTMTFGPNVQMKHIGAVDPKEQGLVTVSQHLTSSRLMILLTNWTELLKNTMLQSPKLPSITSCANQW